MGDMDDSAAPPTWDKVDMREPSESGKALVRRLQAGSAKQVAHAKASRPRTRHARSRHRQPVHAKRGR